jgi:hypothetical protein
MRIGHTILTLAPSLAALGLVWVQWDMVEVFAIYTPPLLIGIALLALLPLGVQLVRWRSAGGPGIPHPFGIVLPLGLLLVLPMWPVGERVASWCPALCEVSTFVEVKPKRPGKFGPSASFSAGATGQGNPSSYQFSLVTIIYTTSERRKDDLYVLLPGWEGFYINSYTTHFPVTREKILEYVQGSDDFPEHDTEAIADELWTVLHDFAAQRKMPPFVYRDWDPRHRIVYWVPGRNVYLATASLCIPILFVVSWLLAGWYARCIQRQQESRPPRPGVGIAQEKATEPGVPPDCGGIT